MSDRETQVIACVLRGPSDRVPHILLWQQYALTVHCIVHQQCALQQEPEPENDCPCLSHHVILPGRKTIICDIIFRQSTLCSVACREVACATFALEVDNFGDSFELCHVRLAVFTNQGARLHLTHIRLDKAIEGWYPVFRISGVRCRESQVKPSKTQLTSRR